MKKITEPDDTEESNTNNLIKKLTEIKHVTNQKNHLTMTIKTDGSKQNSLWIPDHRLQYFQRLEK